MSKKPKFDFKEYDHGFDKIELDIIWIKEPDDTKDIYVGWIEEMPGCIAQSSSLEQLKKELLHTAIIKYAYLTKAPLLKKKSNE